MNFSATAYLIFPHICCISPHCQSSVTNCNISALSVIPLERVTKDSVECQETGSKNHCLSFSQKTFGKASCLRLLADHILMPNTFLRGIPQQWWQHLKLSCSRGSAVPSKDSEKTEEPLKNRYEKPKHDHSDYRKTFTHHFDNSHISMIR